MAQKRKYGNTETKKIEMVFGKLNYQLLIVSILVVVLGFVLMAGKNDIYSFTKITIAPIVVVAGFALGIVSILINPNKSRK
ncbi:DUF3098 domain-containing protein [Olivibacter sitiensis]|uniref:DUF3098 domain-containing protein n=1 Tax=Olivibacter sitiensis TaxID=376470 RepID=UPI0003F802F6|nr:DUF3098 domain-containing protein [Olivibacter sitiensis]